MENPETRDRSAANDRRASAHAALPLCLWAIEVLENARELITDDLDRYCVIFRCHELLQEDDSDAATLRKQMEATRPKDTTPLVGHALQGGWRESCFKLVERLRGPGWHGDPLFAGRIAALCELTKLAADTDYVALETETVTSLEAGTVASLREQRDKIVELLPILRALHDDLETYTVAESDGESVPDSPTGFQGGAALADALGVHPTQRNAFFQRLMRQRMSLGNDCWHEVRDPLPNSPHFLYRVDSPKLRDLAASYKSPKPT